MVGINVKGSSMYIAVEIMQRPIHAEIPSLGGVIITLSGR
jgi:hypothetical protein